MRIIIKWRGGIYRYLTLEKNSCVVIAQVIDLLTLFGV
nr:MAG TPA: hypothetical protein [Caudoviricetes sp.]